MAINQTQELALNRTKEFYFSAISKLDQAVAIKAYSLILRWADCTLSCLSWQNSLAPQLASNDFFIQHNIAVEADALKAILTEDTPLPVFLMDLTQYNDATTNSIKPWEIQAWFRNQIQQEIERLKILSWSQIGEFPNEHEIWRLGKRWRVEYTSANQNAIIRNFKIYRIGATEELFIKINDGFGISSKVEEIIPEVFLDRFAHRIDLMSNDTRLIAFLLKKILLLQPEFSNYIIKISNAISVDLESAYPVLPHWVQDKTSYANTKNEDNIESVSMDRCDYRSNDIGLFIRFRTHEIYQACKSQVESWGDFQFDPHDKNKRLKFTLKDIEDFSEIIEKLTDRAPELKIINAALHQHFIGLTRNWEYGNSLVRHSLKQPFLERLKTQPDLKELVDELSDRLLYPLSIQKKTNELACDHMVSMWNSNYGPFKEKLTASGYWFPNLLHKHDFKSIVMKKRFYDNFIHDHSDRYKDDHVSILLQIIPKELVANLIYEDGEFRGGGNAIESLRRNLQNVTSIDDFNTDAAYIGLMILSKYWPLNEHDPCSIEIIPDNKRLFISTGHQFDIEKFMEFNRERPWRPEDRTGRKIIHPISNQPILGRDLKHIFDMIGAEHLRFHGNFIPSYLDMLLIFRKKNWRIVLYLASRFSGFMQLPAIEGLAEVNDFKRGQLIQMFHSSSEFIHGFETLMKYGVSIQEFIQFEPEKKILLTKEHWLLVLFISDINPNKITSLSVEALSKLNRWLYDQDFSQSPAIGKGWPNHQISKLEDCVQIEQKLDQLIRSESSPSSMRKI